MRHDGRLAALVRCSRRAPNRLLLPTCSHLRISVHVMTLDEICENVRALSARHGWNQTDVASRMLFVTSEVGEVADSVIAVQQATNGASSAEVAASKWAAGIEIYDAIWNLCALANALEVDLAAAAREKAAVNAKRSWG